MVGERLAILHEKPAKLPTLRPEVPEVLESTVERLLAKAPEDRFETADDVATLLEWSTIPQLEAPASPPAFPTLRLIGGVFEKLLGRR